MFRTFPLGVVAGMVLAAAAALGALTDAAAATAIVGQGGAAPAASAPTTGQGSAAPAASAPTTGQGSAAPADFVPEPPPTFKGGNVTVDERLGAKVALQARFRDHRGKLVTLGEVLSGEVPTILTFNYSDCPMLCSLQLNGLSAVLDAMAVPAEIRGADSSLVQAGRDAVVQLGAQFRVVTVVLEPSEPLARTQATRESYLNKISAKARTLAASGWTFLSAVDPKDGRAIAALADSVGFRYTYIPERAEWAHPAALIFLSTSGTVTRYVYGTQFEPDVIRESIIKAGLSEPSTAYGFMNRCYHYDPEANSHARAGMLALRIGALAFLTLMILAFVGRRFRRRASGPGVMQA
jgi:protein SCO1